MAFKQVSLASGQSAYDYLKTERTELLPFAAFNAIGDDLLGRVTAGQASGVLEAQLGDDLEALLFVRIPQFPSSRAFGSDPVLSLREYQQRAPANRADWQIVPVPPRLFPAALRDPSAPRERKPASVKATWVWAAAATSLALLTAIAVRRRRARGAAKSSAPD
jgi:hypothetical protein